MSDRPSTVSRRVVLGGLGVAATGGALLPARAGAVPRVAAATLPAALSVTPTVFRHLRLPAAAFRPTSSAAVWQIAAGALQTTGAATFTAAVVPTEGDLIEELRVELDPNGQGGTITFARHRAGGSEVLVSGTYPATSGATTVALPLPARPHVAEPSSWSYEVTVGLGDGATLLSALVESIGGTAGLVLVGPVRVWDSRDADPYKLQPGVSQGGKLASGGSIGFSLQGVVPTFNAGALLNVTLDQTEAAGYLTVYGPGESGEAPSTSNVNWFSSNQIIANLVITKLGGEAFVGIKAGGGGRTHVIVDVLGYLV